MGDETPVFDEVSGEKIERAADAAPVDDDAAEPGETEADREPVAASGVGTYPVDGPDADIDAVREHFLAGNPQCSGARVDVTGSPDAGFVATVYGW